MHLSTVITATLLSSAFAAPHAHNKFHNFTVGKIVQTSSGSVKGHAAQGYPDVSEYLGIPFAKAPIGDLRFAAPVKYTSNTVINASHFGSACPIRTTTPTAPTPELIAFSNVTAVGLELFNLISSTAPGVGYSEDCLFLNVWSRPQSGERKKAVLVFIHGGGFVGGTASASQFVGADLVDKEDVIIVSLNYRLSILGFPGNPSSQSNLAFLDQRLALEWVRENILSFGGDPSRITLFGQSAGAASADYLNYAYATDPIAAGVISQSGTAFAFGLPYPAATIAQNWYTVTSSLGCGNASTNATAMLACMRALDYRSILNAVPSDGINALLSPFGPSVDDTLVFANYSQQTPAKIPVMVGSNDYEVGLFRTQFALGGLTLPDSDWQELNLAMFTCPTSARANASLSQHNPTYRYRFHGIYPDTIISSYGGSYHGAELPLLFGYPSAIVNRTAPELKIQKYIQGAWTAFAKDPVNGMKKYEGGWPKYDARKKTLVRLAYEDKVGTNLAFPEEYDAGCPEASFEDLLCRIYGMC